MALNFYCSNLFKDEYVKLIKKKSYNDLEPAFIDFLAIGSKDTQDFFEGTKLNGNIDTDPSLIKKRLLGSGGYRLYYYLYIVKNKIYFIGVHPKTGKRGKANEEDIKDIKKQFKTDLQNNNIFEISVKNKKVIFKQD